MEALINKRIWSTVNLNVTKFNNGDEIFEAKTTEEWNEASEKKIAAWCEPEFKSENGYEYGKLYNYYAISDKRGLVPDGFKIPDQKEWLAMIKYFEGEAFAGKILKSRSIWESPGEDKYNFNALPVGFRYHWGEYSEKLCGQTCCFWSLTESKEEPETHAKGINIKPVDKIDTRDFITDYPKGQGRTVRLIKIK